MCRTAGMGRGDRGAAARPLAAPRLRHLRAWLAECGGSLSLRASPRVIHAFGHGHLGLTQSAATGRLVADMVGGRAPTIDIAPFSAQRF